MWKRMFGKYLGQIKELYNSLTLSQRLTAAVLAGTVFLGLLFLAFLTGRESYASLATHRDQGELHRMSQQLEEAGYKVKLKGTTLQVAESELPGALNYVATRTQSKARRDGWAYLDQSPKWGESSVRLSEKKKRCKTINLEESIKVSPDIVDAIVEMRIQQSPLTVIGTEEEGNSASVTVMLAPGIRRLDPEQVKVVRNIVSGGAPIHYDKVNVTDNRMNFYPVDSTEDGNLLAYDRRRLAYIKHYKKEISRYLDRTFTRNQYSLFVDVKLNRKTVESTSELIQPPDEPVKIKEKEETEESTRHYGGKESPGTGTNVGGRVRSEQESPSAGAGATEPSGPEVEQRKRSLTETEFAGVVGRKKMHESSPAGEIQGISVVGTLDKEAVAEIVGKLKEGTEQGGGRKAKNPALTPQKYIKDIEEEIKRSLEIHGTANVSMGLGYLVAAREPVRKPQTSTILHWAGENIPLLAMILIGAGALGLVFMLARRSIPPPVEIPSVEFPEQEAVQKEEGGGMDSAEAEEELDAEDKALSDGIEDIKKLSRERPEVASGVVKMWLGASEKKEGNG